MDELMEISKKLPNGKMKSLNKDTRWERIRNRHMNSLNVRTETVKKFFELDYIDTKQMKMLNGDLDENSKINPALVMDLRHEMIERVDKRKRAVAIEREMAMERLKRHNQLVENHYIENELKKFKADMEKTRLEASKRLQKPKICLDLTNKTLYENLESCNTAIDDFYSAPIDAMKEVSRIYEESKQKFNITANETAAKLDNDETEKSNEIIETFTTTIIDSKDKINCKIIQKKDVPKLKDKNQIKKMEKKKVEKDIMMKTKNNQKEESRCVRFDNSIEVISYCAMDSECDNNSEKMDSEISDLADQVLHIIEGEINMEMIGKNVQNFHTDELNNHNFVNAQDMKENYEQIVEVHKTINRSELIEKDIVLKINDDLLRITKLEPQSNDIKVIVEVQPPSDDESEKSNSDISNEHNAIIADLFRPKFPQKEILMRQYFLKWIHYVTIEKFERENCTHKTSRLSKINAFLDTLRKEKRKVSRQTDETEKPFENHNGPSREKSIVLTKKYRNKIKVQQDIIELQKLKLERQERMIMELKLKKISEDTALSRQELKNELKTMIRTGETKSRLKAKSLQLVGNLRDEEDEENDRLQVKSLMMPKFLQKMQDRALERNVKHEQARQRRLQKDAEKEAAKMAAEEAKREEDEEAKRLRIEALQEKRRQEKMAKIIKERERQRAIANIKKSQDFCHRLRLQFGMNAFKLLICLKRKNYRKAEKLRKKLLAKDHFIAWRKHCVQVWENKTNSANQMYIQTLKLKIFRSWIIYTADEKSKYLVSVDWYELKISEFLFKHWVGYTKLQKMIEESKTIQAESHFQWHLKWSVLEKWQRLPQILKLERETEARRQRWRLKIWELLPDYTPNQRCEDSD